MKKYIIATILSLGFLSYGQLTPLNPFQDIGAFKSIVVQGDLIALATDENKIARSTDAGLSWDIISTNIPYGINELHSPAAGVIYGCGNSGKIIRSTDSGLSWAVLATNTTTDLFDISSVNGNLLFACGANGLILKSTNGGDSWSASSPVPFRLNAVKFSGPQTGWAAGDYGVVLKTTDAGTSWSRISGVSADCNFAVIALFGHEAVYIFGREGQLLATTDGGNEWKYEFQDFYMDGDTVVAAWVYGRDTVVYADDRGALSMATMTPARIEFGNFGNNSPVVAKYYDAFRTPDKKFFVAGSGPSLSKAFGSGTTWTSMLTLLRGRDLRFLRFSGDKLAMVSDPFSSQVFVSYNGGVNWNLTKQTTGLRNLQGLNSGKLFITDIYSWYSTDSAKTWKKFNNPSGSMEDVVFLDNEKGYCIIYYSMPVPSDPKGRFYHTTNGGASWVQLAEFQSWRVLDLFADQNGLVWITQEVTRELLTSSNYGQTFTGIYLPVQGEVAGANIGQKGYLAFRNGKIVHTTAVGAGFSVTYNDPSVTLYAVSNSYSGRSLAVGSGGTIIATIDYGASWSYINTGTNLDLTSVWLLPDMSFVVTTSNGEILKGERPGIFTGIEDENTEVPRQFTLGNYPNPFNGSTVIHFTLPEDSECKLEVFSPIGSQVFEADIKGTQGNNTYNFDASALNSGVYLYRLTAGGKALTGKMILLK